MAGALYMSSPLDNPCKEGPVMGFIWAHCYPQAELWCCTTNMCLDTQERVHLQEKVFEFKMRILVPPRWPLLELVIVYYASGTHGYLANLAQLL